MLKKLAIATLAFVFLLAGCTTSEEAEEESGMRSIYEEIILDGEYTDSLFFAYGMSVEDVLAIIDLEEEELLALNTYTLDAETSPVEGASEMTQMVTQEHYCYAELGEDLPFRLLFTFYDDALRNVTYNVYINVETPSEGYDIAYAFMNDFIEKTGAQPIDESTDAAETGSSYQTYGSADKDSFLTAGGHYACQFFNSGVLAEIGMSSFALTADQGYDQEVMVQLGISMMLDRLES